MRRAGRNWKVFVPKLFFSFFISALLLSLLIRFTLTAADMAVWPSLTEALSHFSPKFILIYIVASLGRTLLQALRYRLLLAAVEKTVPSLFHIIIVTLSRNMFVDMLPARLGELSYIAMLNKGYRVSGRACISSLALSFIFDLIGLGVIILGLIGFQFINGVFQKWVAGVLLILVMLITVLLVLLFPALKIINRILGNIDFMRKKMFSKGLKMSTEIEDALRATAREGITLKLFGLSVGIRVLKYFSLFCLFIGVVNSQFPQMTTDILKVLPALISAEAGASLPIPTFLGFGTYEAGGTMALIALGAKKATALIVMLAMHITSQAADYLLGSIGVILFIFKTTSKPVTAPGKKKKTSWLHYSIYTFLLGAAAILLVFQLSSIKKRGALNPPKSGEIVTPAVVTKSNLLQQFNGFVVWSSNRSGNHDIYMYSLPEGKIRQITNHPHTEYFPRISPDGKQIVFARSHTPWVSQRNYHAWDIWQLDLETGKEHLLARNGNTPTWSATGRQVYFQRNSNEVIELDIKTMKEKRLYKSKKTIPVPAETVLETPNISSRKDRLAVTFRKTMRATAIVSKQGDVKKVGKGCQLTWGPDDKYLYTIDHGGKMQNAIYKIDPITGKAEKWFDAPGNYSHEYFPRISNNGVVLVYGASKGDHTHDTADYEIFLWQTNRPANEAVRITYHTGNDCWPDVFLR